MTSTKSRTRRFVTEVVSYGPGDVDREGFRYALIHVDVLRLKARYDLYQELKQHRDPPEELVFYDPSATFCGQPPNGLTDDEDSELEDGNVLEIVGKRKLTPVDEDRTSRDQVVLLDSGVAWRCMRRYDAGTFETLEIPYAELFFEHARRSR